jgi:protein-L-isoaspartate O-methyltransferase
MSLYSALRDKIITTAQAREIAVRVHERGLADAERWIQHISNRLEYERAMLAEDGGTAQGKFDPQAVVVGGRVLADNEWLIVLKVNKAGGVVNSVTTMAPRVVSWQKTWKYGIERIKDYRAPEAGEAEKVIAATKLPPLCNYPGEGFTQITKAEWDRKCSDYKGTRVIAATETAGRHRVRHGMFANYTQAFVYLTDVKRVDPPKPKASEEPAKLDRVYADVAETVVPRKREVDETAAGFDALKDSLKAGVKVVSAPQLFPTPPELAQRMVEEAQIRPGETVLEPSAGTGNLLKAIRKDAGDCVYLTAVEIDERLTDIVRMARKVHYGDFLQCNGDLGKFDRILMNPPFVNGDDIKHIQHAIKFLKPNGRLVAICAGGPRQQAVLQPLAENSGGIWEPLEPGTFKESGTMVNAVLLTIEG